jgi:Coenzyme PQQ synthesis protein D (PqqD)
MDNAPNSGPLALARQEDLVVQEMPDEVLLYDLRRHKAHCLNKTAALIWQHCDGQTTVTEMAKRVQREAGPAVDEDVIRYALGKLGEADLLAERPDPGATRGLSRRQMVKRLGGLALVPAVLSLVSPAAAQGLSIIATNQKSSPAQCRLRPTACEGQCCTGLATVFRICNRGACNGPRCVPIRAAEDCAGRILLPQSRRR